MAEVKRFSGNTTITQGTGTTALSLADIIPVQPTSQGASVEDKKSSLANIKAVPYAVCATAGATAAKTATMQNFKNSTAEVGNVIKVKFNNANTADNITLSVAGHNGALKARGVQMMKGSIPAGSYIDVMWDGSAWIADTEIVEADSSAGYTKYWDGRIIYSIFKLTDFNFDPSTLISNTINAVVPFVSVYNPANKPSNQNVFYGQIYHNNDAPSQWAYYMICYDHNGSLFKRRFSTQNNIWMDL